MENETLKRHLVRVLEELFLSFNFSISGNKKDEDYTHEIEHSLSLRIFITSVNYKFTVL